MHRVVAIILLLALICSPVGCKKRTSTEQMPIILSVVTATPQPLGPQLPRSEPSLMPTPNAPVPYPMPSVTPTLTK